MSDEEVRGEVPVGRFEIVFFVSEGKCERAIFSFAL